jgi:hypothetical protein
MQRTNLRSLILLFIVIYSDNHLSLDQTIQIGNIPMNPELLPYRGYTGSIRFSTEDGLMVGKVLGINDSLNFDGRSAEEMKARFENTIDDYLMFCAACGVAPDLPGTCPHGD